MSRPMTARYDRIHFRRALIFILTAWLVAAALPPAASAGPSEEIGRYLKQFSDYELFQGTVMVQKDGATVFSGAYGPANREWDIANTPETRFRIGSLTKQFTAAMILQLARERKLAFDQPVTRYLPDYPAEPGNRVTIHHLLTHTSGIPGYTELPEFESDISRDPYKPEEFVKVFSGLPLAFEPGTSWAYSNSGYFILGVIIEKLTGMSYEAALQARILDPLELRDTGYDHPETIIPRRAAGYERVSGGYRNTAYLDMSLPYAAGSIYSTAGDLCKWARALTSGPFLSAQERELMFKAHADIGQAGVSYGYGVMTRMLPAGKDGAEIRTVEHGGGINGFNSYLLTVPEERIIVALLANVPARVNEPAVGIVKLLHGQPADPPKQPISQVLGRLIEEKGMEQAVAEYRRLKQEKPDVYRFSEGELNALGYGYLQSGAIDRAVAVFELNAQEYPASANVHDSLGEALLARGDTARAVDSYRKALEVNPRQENAKAVLRRLGIAVDENLGTEIHLPAEILDRYTGRYELAPGFVLTVTREGSQLMTQATGQQKVPVFAESETKFFLKVVDARIEFQVAADGGKAASLSLQQAGQIMPARRIPD